jgi:hypothetical protein
MDKPLVVCIFWGMQYVQSSKIRCSSCPNEIAIDEGNFRTRTFEQFIPICPECFLKLADPQFGGFAIAGQVFNSLDKVQFPLPMVEHVRGIVKSWRSSRN